jgi:tRNA(Arg) A34 adenosine deaminase TadA
MKGDDHQMTITADDLVHLRRCVELAREALDDGDEPFGSVLVSAGGAVLFEDRNRIRDGDSTRHPEFEISRWSAAHLQPGERAAATVYTSGEHCPMCAAAHGWVGLGRIVYAASAGQLVSWLTEWGAPAAPVAALPIRAVVPSAVVDGPAPELLDAIKALHRARFRQQHAAPSGGERSAR